MTGPNGQYSMIVPRRWPMRIAVERAKSDAAAARRRTPTSLISAEPVEVRLRAVHEQVAQHIGRGRERLQLGGRLHPVRQQRDREVQAADDRDQRDHPARPDAALLDRHRQGGEQQPERQEREQRQPIAGTLSGTVDQCSWSPNSAHPSPSVIAAITNE